MELVDGLARVPRAPGRLPPGDDHLHIGAAQARQAHTVLEHVRDAGAGQPGVEPKARAAGRKALQMRIQPEEGAVPDGHHIVSGVGPQKTPVGDGNGGLGNGNILAPHEGHPLGIIR